MLLAVVVVAKKSSNVCHTASIIPHSSRIDDPRTAVAFKVYDVDRDGYISNGELFLVLKMMVGNNLKVCPLATTQEAKILKFGYKGPTITTNR